MGMSVFVLLAAAVICSCLYRTAALVCDGKQRVLDMPTAPYPTRDTYYYPIATPPEFTCQRLDEDATSPRANKFCGGREEFTCTWDGVTFGPVGPIAHGTGGQGPPPYDNPGQGEAVVTPSNPIIYSLTNAAPNAYLTYIQFTVADVGTGGARLVGVYGNDPKAGPNVTANYNWTVNGDQGGSLRCGACSDCRQGFGVANIAVEAAPGSGFRAVQLSSQFEDVRCGGSCRDSDGIYWSSMEYKCVSPTCADTNLDESGLQPVDCVAVGLVAKTGVSDATDPSPTVCCEAGREPTNPTCGNSNPAMPGMQYDCPAGTSYNMSASTLPASDSNCCTKDPTCVDSDPVVPGVRYKCPSGKVYNGAADTLPASESNCCVDESHPTCLNSNAAGERYTCPAGYSYREEANNLPASDENCCLCTPISIDGKFGHFGKFGKFFGLIGKGKGGGLTCAKPSFKFTAPAPEKVQEVNLPQGGTFFRFGGGFAGGPLTTTAVQQPQQITFQLPFSFTMFGRRRH